MFDLIKISSLKTDPGYVYSDLHYMLYPSMVKRIAGIGFDNYLRNVYNSLGAYTLGFNPLLRYPKSKIAPTEYDKIFRKGLVHGFVHDEAAAMLGGVSGHAGLFGSANDLTKLMQLYLQKGYYGGQQIISRNIVETWTDYQFPYIGNRRGLAFDKLDFNKSISNGPQMASAKSFGHSGFTGTFAWVDPAFDMVYVFLSNRVYPTRDNNKIGTLNIRTELGNQIIKTIKGK
jgi:CubicO group peptidase (beta-lactamase class C family)